MKDRGIAIRIRRKKITNRRRLKEQEEINNNEEKPEQQEQEEETGRFVLPGDLIGTSEEFTAKNGCFEAKGNIYASVIGVVKINEKERTIMVSPVTNTPVYLHEGDIVIGRVMDVKDSYAMVEIARIKGKGEREIVNLENAVIHVSNVKDAYVKDMCNEFAPLDIVKAEVIDIKNMRLSTMRRELGVMKAYCGNCRTVLRIDNGKLKCPACGRVETRKLSSHYGTGII